MDTIGSLQYFLWIIGFIGIGVGLHFLLINKKEFVKKWTIFGLLMLAFVLHFTKILYVKPTSEWTLFNWLDGKNGIELTNLCSVSVVLFPFLFLFGNRFFKNGFIVLGITSGVISFLIPTEVEKIQNLDVYGVCDQLRFYIQHGIIWIAPMLCLSLNLYQMKWKEFYQPWLYIMLCLIIIVACEGVWTYMGWQKRSGIDGWNTSFQWGPEKGALGSLFTWIVPKALFTYNGKYIPVFWLTLPIFFYFSIFALIITMFDHFKNYPNKKIMVKAQINKIKSFKLFKHKQN